MLLGLGPDGPVTGRRVAITGIGVVSSVGSGADAFWAGLHGPAPEGERRVHDFDPEQWFSTKEARTLDRFAQFSVAVADMALADAGDLDADPGRSGVIMGTGVGGLQSLETQILVYADKGARRVSPRLVPMMMSNAGAAAVSMRLGWHGPSETVITACAAGAHSIAHAARLVASGRCDVAVGGAAEAGMTNVGIAAFANMTALSTTGTVDALRRPARRLRHDRGRRRAAYSRTGTGPWPGARASTASWPARPARRTPTTSPRRRPAGTGAAACMQLAMDDAGIDSGRGPPHQRPRHVHAAQRPGRVGCHRQGVRSRLAPGDLDQGRHRPRPRGERCHRGGGRAC